MKTLLFCVFALAVLVFSPYGTSAQERCRCPSERILLQISAISVQEDVNKKILDTEALIRMTAALSPTELEMVDQRAILLLAQSLQDPDDGVRMWIAAALSEFGHRAEPALPALEIAYDNTVVKPISEDVPVLPSTSARLEIRSAIERIKEEVAGHTARDGNER